MSVTEEGLKRCFSKMVTAIRIVEDAKEDCKEELESAYKEYTADVEFGDADDIVDYKAMVKLAKAQVKDDVDKLKKELEDTKKAVFNIIGEAVQAGLDFGGSNE